MLRLLSISVLLFGSMFAGDSPVVPPYIHHWYTAGQWVEWKTKDAAAGDYELTLRYGTRYPTKRKIEVNGVVVPGLESLRLADTFGWINFADLKLPAKLKLKDGENTIRITCLDDASMAVNALTLTGPKTIALKGIKFNSEGGGKVQVVVSDEGGFINQWDNAGHALEWQVDVPVAGEYEMAVRYATMTEAAREVQINGVVAKGLESFTVVSTGSWRNWGEATLPQKVKLNAGKNTIRLHNANGTSLNLNSMVFTLPGRDGIVVYAVDYTKEDVTNTTTKGGGKVSKTKKPRSGEGSKPVE